jgi:hypothetical protein
MVLERSWSNAIIPPKELYDNVRLKYTIFAYLKIGLKFKSSIGELFAMIFKILVN